MPRMPPRVGPMAYSCPSFRVHMHVHSDFPPLELGAITPPAGPAVMTASCCVTLPVARSVRRSVTLRFCVHPSVHLAAVRSLIAARRVRAVPSATLQQLDQHQPATLPARALGNTYERQARRARSLTHARGSLTRLPSPRCGVRACVRPFAAAPCP